MEEEKDHIRIAMDELHHRMHDIRDHLFKGESLVLTRREEPLAVIRPMDEEDSAPGEALVRSITSIRLHKRNITYRLEEGNRIVLTYRGRKMGVVDPDLSGYPS